MREHRKDDFITKLIHFDYDPEAECPIYREHLQIMFEGKQELIDYMQEVLGSCLIGNSPERGFHIMQGSGRNGKGVLTKGITLNFADYVRDNVNASVISKDGNSVNLQQELANLRGKRMALVEETDTFTRLCCSTVKKLTGGSGSIEAREVYQRKHLRIPLQATWIVCTNNDLAIFENTPAMLERISVIQCNVFMPDAIKKASYEVMNDRLRAEAAGITNFYVEGICRLIERAGEYKVPDCVLNWTREYLGQFDYVQAFIDECLEEAPEAYVPKADLFEAFRLYLRESSKADEDSFKKSRFDKRFGSMKVGSTSITEGRGSVQAENGKRSQPHCWFGFKFKEDSCIYDRLEVNSIQTLYPAQLGERFSRATEVQFH